MMPSSAKSIYPVIASFANEHRVSFPGERTMAILSGRTDKTVREGIKHLENLQCIRVVRYTTSRGRRSKKFHVKIPSPKRGDTYPFYRSVLESGVWQELKPVAQALYPVLRSYGFFDQEVYWEHWAPVDQFEQPFNCVYPKRLLDFVEADRSILVDRAGIDYRSFDAALSNLVRLRLVGHHEEPSGIRHRVVFLHPFSGDCENPEICVPRDYLHRKIRKRYRAELRPLTCRET